MIDRQKAPRLTNYLSVWAAVNYMMLGAAIGGVATAAAFVFLGLIRP
jgi:hypothetical protein